MKCLTKIRYSRSNSVPNLICLITLALFIFNSCTSLRNIEIEVAVQPKFPIAEDIQSLVLLNRSMTKQFTNIKADTLEKILIRNAMKMDTVFQDSIASDTVIQVAARVLFESGRFDVVVPKERNIIRAGSEYIANPVNIDFTREICDDFNVDAVLVLEYFTEYLQAKQMTKKEYWDNKGINLSGYPDFFSTIQIVCNSEWRLYRPNMNKTIFRFQVADSIFWKAESFSLKALYFQMPSIKTALIGGGIAAALKMCYYISPEWISLDRYYFITGSRQIDAAIPLIKDNKWKDAQIIWAKYAEIPSKSIRSKVEFNLALASEMNGDLQMAMQWCRKSLETNQSLDKKVYLNVLAQRLKEQEIEDAKRKI